MIQKKMKAGMAATLFALLALSSLPVATGATTADGVEVDANVGGTSVLDSTVWINAAGSVDFDLPLDASNSNAGGVNTVAFKLSAEGAGQTGEGLDYTEGTPVPDFTGQVYDSELDEVQDASGFFWQIREASGPITCGTALEQPEDNCISEGDPLTGAATFQVTVGKASMADFAPVQFDLVTFTDSGADPNPPSLMLGLDTGLPELGTIAFTDGSSSDAGSHHSEADTAFDLSFTASDALSGLQLPTITAGPGSLACSGFTAGDQSASCTVAFAAGELAEGDNTITVSVTDVAGNAVAATESITIKIDRTPPTATPVVSGASADVAGTTWYTVDPTVTFTPVDAAGLDEAAGFSYTLDGGAPVAGSFTAGTGTIAEVYADGQTVLAVTASDVAHTANSGEVFSTALNVDKNAPTLDAFTLTETDNDLLSNGIDAAEMSDCTDGSGDKCINFSYDVTDGAGSGVQQVQLQWFLPGTTDWLNVGSASTGASGGFEVTPARVGTHQFRLVATDHVGNQATLGGITVDLTPPASQVHADIATAIASVSDSFTRTGQLVTFTVETTVPGSDPVVHAKNVKVEVRDQDGVLVSTLTTNSAGAATFSTSRAAAGSHTFTATAIQQLGSTGFSDVSEQGDLAGRAQEVTWTRLVPSSVAFTAGKDVAGRGDALGLEMVLTWDHDGSAATGLLDGDDSLGFSYSGTGAGASDVLVPDAPAGGVLLGATESTTPGTYALGFVHPTHESISFGTTGTVSAFTTGDADDAATSFSVPSGPSMVGHWVGVFVDGPLSLENLDDAGDATDHFVNEDERVLVSATLRYTGNFDPAAADGLNDGTVPNVAAQGAVASLFQTSHLDETFVAVPDDATLDNSGARLTSAPADADGLVTFTVDRSTFLPGGANAYDVEVLATSALDGDIAQAFDDAGDRADHGAPGITLTFTGVQYALAAGFDAVAAGVEDVEGSVWWLDADDPDAGSAADAVTFSVQGLFSHDQTPAAGATVGAFWGDGSPLLASDGLTQLTAVADGAGVAAFTIDPDDFLEQAGVHDLDYAVHELDFHVLSAPEPLAAPHVITHDAGGLAQGLLWTRILTTIVPNPAVDVIDDELSVGQATFFNAVFSWYHDADDDGLAHGLGDADAGDALTLVELAGAGIDVDDTVADATVMDERDDAEDVAAIADGLDLVFSPTRGCVDFPACNTPDLALASWHTLEVALDGVANPHGIRSDADAIDLLWTGVLLDATTDELVVEAGDNIDVTVSAHHAHKTDAAGVPLADRTFDRPVTYDLVDLGADLVDNLDDADVVTAKSFTGTAAADTVTAADPGHRTFQARLVSIDDAGGDLLGTVFGTPSDLRVGSHSAQLERVWLGLDVGFGNDEHADGTPDDSFVEDQLVVRGTDVDVLARVVVTDGVTDAPVTGAYAGYTFDREDTHPVDATLTRSADPVAFAGDLSLLLTGSEALNTQTVDLALTDGDDDGVWTATIPGAAHLLAESDVAFDLVASLQVTDASDGDSALTLGDAVDDGFVLDYTAVAVGLAGFVGEDGALWRDYDGAGSLQVTANWAHDEQAAAEGATLAVVRNPDTAAEVLVAPTDITVVESAPGVYDVAIATPGPSRDTYAFFVTEVPDLEDAGESFTDAALDATNLLTDAALVQDVIFTAVEFRYAETPDADATYLNKGEGVNVPFEVVWAHDPAHVFNMPTAWTFPSGGVAGEKQAIAERDDTSILAHADGVVHLVSGAVGTETLAPTYDTDGSFTPNGITASIVPSAGVGNNPTFTWTELSVVPGATGGPSEGSLTDPEGGTSPYFAAGQLAEQAFVFQFAHDASIVPDGSDVLVGGVAKTTSAGSASALFTSQSEGWYKLLGSGLGATAPDGKAITATGESSQWVGFDADGDHVVS